MIEIERYGFFWKMAMCFSNIKCLEDAEASVRGSTREYPWDLPAPQRLAIEWYANGVRIAAEVSSQGRG